MRARGMRRGLIVLLGVMVAALLALGPVSAIAATDRLPDLRMAVPADVRLCAAPVGNQVCPAPVADGTRYLRFSATIVNVGKGPLIIRATRDCPDCPRMSTRQVIVRSNGTRHSVRTAAEERYVTDDHHNHWHVIGMEHYALYRSTKRLPGDVPLGHKYGFCFFDGLPYALGLRRASHVPVFSFFDCGVPTSQALRVGLSVGWGDIYPWDFTGQFIDVSNVPDGDYLVCLGADPANDFRELHNANNQAWARVSLTATSVTVVSTGRSPCQTQLPYPIPADRSATDGSESSPGATAPVAGRMLEPQRGIGARQQPL